MASGVVEATGSSIRLSNVIQCWTFSIRQRHKLFPVFRIYSVILGVIEDMFGFERRSIESQPEKIHLETPAPTPRLLPVNPSKRTQKKNYFIPLTIWKPARQGLVNKRQTHWTSTWNGDSACHFPKLVFVPKWLPGRGLKSKCQPVTCRLSLCEWQKPMLKWKHVCLFPISHHHFYVVASRFSFISFRLFHFVRFAPFRPFHFGIWITF